MRPLDAARLIPLPLIALALVLAPGCAEPERLCYPGDYLECTCYDGLKGLQRCEDDGQSYTACDCSGGIPAPDLPEDDDTSSGGYYYY